MTNGEKIQTILDVDRDCTEVHGENGTMTFTVTQDFWNAEYKEPTTVSLNVYKQVAKERDIAIQQLHELGYDFGQKIELTTKNNLGVDCISREQALRELKESAKHHANDSREEMLLRRDRDIIRALPSVTSKSCDAISRQAVIDEMEKRHAEGDCITKGFIKNMPSVTPQPTKNYLGVDAVNRKAVLDVIEREQFKGDAISEIEKLPLVTPQEPNIKALGEKLRKAREGIADEKVLIGYNMAVAICNKYLGGSEVDNGNAN